MLVGLLLSIALVSPTGTRELPSDSFLAKLRYLQGQNHAEIGRQTLVAELEKLIAEHPAHPEAAEAMLIIAHSMENENPQIGLKADHSGALEWFRRAADKAPLATPLWTNAQFMLINRLRFNDVNETRKRLASISTSLPNDSLALARVEHTLQMICIQERDFTGAEEHCRLVLAWYRDRRRVPKVDYTKWELDDVIRSTGAVMVHALVDAPYSKADRAKRIRDLVTDNAAIEALRLSADEALDRLAGRPEDSSNMLERVLAPKASRHRHLLIVSGVTLSLLAWFVLRALLRKGSSHG